MKLLYALIFLIFLSVNIVCAEVTIIEKDLPAPFGGIILDDVSSSKVLLDLQKLPIIEDSCRNLESQVENLKTSGANFNQQVSNLNLQIEQYKQLLEIEKQRSALYKERSEFYIEQNKVKDNLFEQQQKLIEKLSAEAKKKSFWQTVATVEFFTIVGIALGVFGL